MSYSLFVAGERVVTVNKQRKAMHHTVMGFEHSYDVVKTQNLKTLLDNDALDNIDTEFDNEYNAVVDSIYVKTFYNTSEDI